jgi:hypothetical protein
VSSAARLAAAALFLAVAWTASANFGGSDGFSGKNGLTCLACHTVPPLVATEATATLEGLPADGWLPGASYLLTVRVGGGPAAMPAPQPQGGFDLAVGAGRLAVPAGMEDLVRLPDAREATYTADGTLRREWQVAWTAPDLAHEPQPAQAWLAVLAANGNHVIAANAADGGERFDATASLQATVPPAPATVAAWRALPLTPPTAAATRADAWQVEGRHADGNATALAFRLDDGAWQARATGPTWRLEVPALPGNHTLELRSEGAGRASPPLALALDGPPAAAATPRAAPGPAVLLPLLLLAYSALLARCRP